MIENCYTFNELKEKYNWEKIISGIPQQIQYAKVNGVEIEVAFKKGKTYFKILSEFKPYTLDELIEEFNFSNYLKVAPPKERENYLKTHGFEIQLYGRKGTTNLYRIIKNESNKVFSWESLCDKYSFLNRKTIPSARIKRATSYGLSIEYMGVSNNIAYYKILNEIVDHWDENEKYPGLEFCREGFVRNKKTEKMYSATNTAGYISILYNGQIVLAHRLLMLVYNPIENADNYSIDHINGIRNDNRLENLRWVSIQENNHYRKENRKQINYYLNQIIQKLGYEGTIEILKQFLEK